MANPLVSIIIPLYNSEKYIEETITSAIGQTWENKEIIIINDGSTDNSLAIVRKFESPAVKIFTQKNSGASAARNRGLAEAKGEYIQFLDADDVLSPDKIEAQVRLLQERKDHVALCYTMHFTDGMDYLSFEVEHGWMSSGSSDPADFLVKMYGGIFIGKEYGGMVQPNSWLTPRHIIDRAGLWDETLTLDDDGEFFCRVLLASRGVVYAENGINYYRKFINRGTLSAGKTRENMQSSLKANLLKVQYLTAATTDPRAKLAMSAVLWENAFNLYPVYRDLAAEAEKEARRLAPQLNYNPYKHGLNMTLAGVLGWKAIKYLQTVKQKMLN